ncbi:MAG: N-acetylneuraminate synthase family protein [Phycisphaerales bacterium]
MAQSEIRNPKSEITLCVILARAGSKGLPGKNTADLCGRPMIEYTIDHALTARCVDKVIVSTDCAKAAGIARRRGVEVIARPAELASDTATVDAAARHAVLEWERIAKPPEAQAAVGNVVILYANVPVRPRKLIDDAVAKLIETGCDSVQSVCVVGKMHPYWMKKLEGDRLLPYVENTVYRRQELPGVYQLDGGIIAVTRRSLFVVEAGQPHAFLGRDRRAVVTEQGGVVDVDGAMDLKVAEGVISTTTHPRRGWAWGGDRVYVIAEIGVNHDGDVERAMELVRAAKECGADAVKLQLFRAEWLLSEEAMLAEYQKKGDTGIAKPQAAPGSKGSAFEMLRRLELNVEEMLRVRGLAKELGLGFVVTPFSLENLEEMKRLEVDAVKIASPDAVNLPLIGAMLGLDKPMLISTGTANIDELRAANRLCAGQETVFLHCVSAYPTPPQVAAVGRMNVLRDALGCEVGYSDHTCDEVSAVLAVGCGARVIEKHLTYDSAASGPDHAASCDPRKFKEYVAAIRAAEAAMTFDETADVQADVRKVSRQSVCAVKDLKAGDVIERGDVTVKRPGTGVAAARLGEVVGKRLKWDVMKNHLIHEEDI